MKRKQNREALLSQFAERRERVEQFAQRKGVSVSALYRWQAEQNSGGFIQMAPEVISLNGAGSLFLQKGDLRIEFTTLPEVVYLQSMLKILLLC